MPTETQTTVTSSLVKQFDLVTIQSYFPKALSFRYRDGLDKRIALVNAFLNKDRFVKRCWYLTLNLMNAGVRKWAGLWSLNFSDKTTEIQ